jgi:hypothetical protein
MASQAGHDGDMENLTSQAGQAGDEAHELSDLELLSVALEEAVDAQRAGVIVGPRVDEVALRRAVCRAVRADVRRQVSGGLAAVGGGDAA